MIFSSIKTEKILIPIFLIFDFTQKQKVTIANQIPITFHEFSLFAKTA